MSESKPPGRELNSGPGSSEATRLTAEELRFRLQEQSGVMRQLQERLIQAEAGLSEVTSSFPWRFVRRYRRALDRSLPRGTRRRRLYDAARYLIASLGKRSARSLGDRAAAAPVTPVGSSAMSSPWTPGGADASARSYARDNKFVICCAARTGSTMLVDMLDSHPRIRCHGEVFLWDRLGPLRGTYAQKRADHPGMGERLERYRLERPSQFLYDVVYDLQGRSAVGLKFKTDEMFDPRYREIRDLLAADQDIKVIFLLRRNLLNQYISHQVVLRQTGITFVLERSQPPSVKPFVIDVDHCVAYLEDVHRRQARARRLYQHHRHTSVVYEDIVGGEGAPVEAIQRFLGVEPIDLRAKTAKLTDSRAVALNYDEAYAELGRRGILFAEIDPPVARPNETGRSSRRGIRGP